MLNIAKNKIIRRSRRQLSVTQLKVRPQCIPLLRGDPKSGREGR